MTSALTIPAHYQSPDTTLDSLRAGWIEACLNFSEANAEQILNQAFSLFSAEVVCTEVLQKEMSEIGDLWYENRASVQQEYFASGLAMRRLDTLLSASPAPTRKQTVIVGCPPDEWHTLMPLLLSLLLRRRGLNVLYLGANVPVSQFTETAKNTKTDLIILVVQQLTSAATLQQTALALSGGKIPIAFGGRIFNLRPGISDSISGYFLGNDLNTALEEIEVILNGKMKQRQPKATSQVYTAAYQAFVSKRAQIDMTVNETLEPLSISPEDIETASHFLGENITAALQLGNMAHVSAEIDWLKGLLQSQGSREGQLVHFLQTYSQVVDKNIDGQGQPIVEWLSFEAQKLTS